MQTIKVGFSKPKTWKPFAKLIMFGYDIPYDHVFVSWHSANLDRDIIYQASSTMVNFMSPVVFAANNDVVAQFDVQISDESYKKLVQFAVDNAGVPYGIKEVVGLILVALAAKLGKTINNPFSDGGTTYVCCELAGVILDDFAGASIAGNQDNWTPKTIYDYLVANNHTV